MRPPSGRGAVRPVAGAEEIDGRHAHAEKEVLATWALVDGRDGETAHVVQDGINGVESGAEVRTVY